MRQEEKYEDSLVQKSAIFQRNRTGNTPFILGVLPGEGIGTEVVGVALRLLEVLEKHGRHKFELRFGGDIGLVAKKSNGAPLPAEIIGFCREIFACGGHSLLEGVLLARTEKRFGRALPFSALFAHATIASQARLLNRENDGSADSSSVIALQPNGSRPPLFLFHDLKDSFLNYRDFLHNLRGEQPIYGVQPLREESSTRSRDLVEMATRYARDSQPRGAFYLCGLSFAGTLAFETARQLERRGRRVVFLALLDTNCRADSAYAKVPTTRSQRQRNHRRIWRRLRPRDRWIY